MKRKLFMSICMVIGLSIITAGAAYANSDEILEKQKEIDNYIFEDHSAEIEEMGITVTHTSPQDKVVEIGITPYNDENANYFYDIFGKENVKVVEGVQATTLSTGLGTTDAPPMETAIGTENENNYNAFYLYSIAVGIMAVVAIIAIRMNKKAKA